MAARDVEQKGPKNGLFLLFLKIQSLVFSDIVHDVRALKTLKIDLGRFLGKILV